MAVIRVEVVDARRDGVSTAKVELPAGALVRDALLASGLNLDPSAVGIFGKRVAPDARLADGDRVELYRPLRLDPKERRRERAKKKLKARR
jgi:putative ubiquitin-RnfH superfamily antitoxin RatB of RatAB toxin-antitoxin module